MSERLSTHNTANPTPTGPASMGLGADLNTYALPLATGGGSVLTQAATTPKAVKTVVGSCSSNTAVIGAVVGKLLKIRYVKLRTAYSAGAIEPLFTDGNGGSNLWGDYMQAPASGVMGSNEGTAAPDCLFATSAGNALYLNPNGQTFFYFISYWDTDAS